MLKSLQVHLVVVVDLVAVAVEEAMVQLVGLLDVNWFFL
jgi:hypothetical protein